MTSSLFSFYKSENCSFGQHLIYPQNFHSFILFTVTNLVPKVIEVVHIPITVLETNVELPKTLCGFLLLFPFVQQSDNLQSHHVRTHSGPQTRTYLYSSVTPVVEYESLVQ